MAGLGRLHWEEAIAAAAAAASAAAATARNGHNNEEEDVDVEADEYQPDLSAVTKDGHQNRSPERFDDHDQRD